MDTPSTFFRNVERQTFWRGVAQGLHIGTSLHPSHTQNGEPIGLSPSLHDRLRNAGYAELTPLLDPAATSALARAVGALRAHDLHPTFLYVYDEAWQVLDALRPHLSAFLGADFEVLSDAWAWHIDPRSDGGGWPVHRGWYEDVRDASGLPGLVNVWVALTDATLRNACMHLVPLSRDPHYPADLKDLTALEHLALPLPIPAGSALVWSANAAHWGGACDPSCDQSRVSMSFTARSHVFPSPPASSIPPLRLPLSFRERLDLIADQFQTYGDKEMLAERHEMRWANAVAGMRVAASRRTRPKDVPF